MLLIGLLNVKHDFGCILAQETRPQADWVNVECRMEPEWSIMQTGGYRTFLIGHDAVTCPGKNQIHQLAFSLHM